MALQIWNGNFVSAVNGGNGVTTNGTYIDGAASFVIQRIRGSGLIRSGDQVALRSINDKYIVAEGGGGGVVNANRDA